MFEKVINKYNDLKEEARARAEERERIARERAEEEARLEKERLEKEKEELMKLNEKELLVEAMMELRSLNLRFSKSEQRLKEMQLDIDSIYSNVSSMSSSLYELKYK